MPMSSIYPQSGFRQPAGYQPQAIPGMSLNMPLGVLQPQQPTDSMIGLHGLDSAKQYPVKPNTTVPTFDLDSDHALNQAIADLGYRMDKCCCEIKTQMLQDKLESTQSDLFAARTDISNAAQSQYLLGQLGRFVAWTPSGSQVSPTGA